ncbi:MAG: sugar ABC transporter substrate-binding protein [Butyrivibrio sp.]|nr:sugar ABC transporter substrate-binding protein [Muribaculum sp.]MCM1551427.1 sugar ABC transporter substrate-binding protein [Butyrivibrio sp.]
MKKIIALLLAAAMTFSLVSCGAADEEKTVVDESLSGEITFWHSFVQGARMEAVERAVAKFEKRYPNVRMNVETMSWTDFKVRWKDGIESGELPDISTACNMYEVEELVNAGILQPADEVVDAIGREQFSDNVLRELTHGDQVYGVPYYSHAYVMWYRKDLLDAKGLSVPSTWEELYKAAYALTDEEQGIYGCPVSMSPKDFVSAINLHMYVRSGGGSLLNDDMTANLTSGLALEGIRYWVKMYENCSPKETLDDTVLEQASLFYDGKTAFDFNSGFHISGVAGSREDLLTSISCAPLPRMNQNDEYYSAVVTHIPLVIYRDAENMDICRRFLEFLFEEENYIDFLDSVPVGMLPSIRGISSTEQYQSNDIRKQFAEEEGVIREAMINGMALGFEHGPNLESGIITSSGVIENMFQDIVQNGTDVETAAKNAEDELNRLFAETVK